MNKLYITECPRDAMQGIHEFIPTELKIAYLNQLLKCGFDVLDFGSFVSPKSIPQLQDTTKVLGGLNLEQTSTKLLAIIANERGADEALMHDEIFYLGFPFSVSETFQQRNTNTGRVDALKRVDAIQQNCERKGKQLMVYLSMAFGNPYGDEWHEDIVTEWALKLKAMGIKNFALADTIGSSTTDSIRSLYQVVVKELANLNLVLHLHSTREEASSKIKAGIEVGCLKFDVAIHGFGGCPMAKKELTGNLATEDLIRESVSLGVNNQLNHNELELAMSQAWTIFNQFH